MSAGRAKSAEFGGTLVVTAAWIAWGLSPVLTEVTAAASGGRRFVGHIEILWPRPTGAELNDPAFSYVILGAALAAAFFSVVSLAMAAVAKRIGLPRYAPLMLALLVAAVGVVPYATLRWEQVAPGGDSPRFDWLLVGLTLAVTCGVQLMVGTLLKRVADKP